MGYERGLKGVLRWQGPTLTVSELVVELKFPV